VSTLAGRAEVVAKLTGLGFASPDAEELADHFLDAEQRGRKGHGLSRVDWLARLPGLEPSARPEIVIAEGGFERWDGRQTLGYLVLARIVRAQLADPPERARLIVAGDCFPTGVLGHHVRRLADGGLVAVLTATSPRRLGHPSGGAKLAGTNPLALGIPSSGGHPIVVDVSMGTVTWGDVVAGLAQEEELVPFGGEQAHKAFALALGLQLLVDALAGDGKYGAALLVAQPAGDPVPALRRLASAAGVRLPGDR
jgi:LDH2 family malate/lactate/ureidoglycolate dehydrogenase